MIRVGFEYRLTLFPKYTPEYTESIRAGTVKKGMEKLGWELSSWFPCTIKKEEVTPSGETIELVEQKLIVIAPNEYTQFIEDLNVFKEGLPEHKKEQLHQIVQTFTNGTKPAADPDHRYTLVGEPTSMGGQGSGEPRTDHE